MPARRLVTLGLILVFATGIFVRLYPIPTRSISHPEIYVPNIHMPEGLSEPHERVTLMKVLSGTFTSDTHPPGYYVFMWAWTKIFGTGIWSIRLPSVIFGLGAIASGARLVTNEMFMAAARTLAQLVSEEDIKQGSLYPALPRIREVSAHIAAAVAEVAYKRGLAASQAPNDLLRYVQSQMYDPRY